jgi:hypothetical protein
VHADITELAKEKDDSAAVLALVLAAVLGFLADRFFFPAGPQGPGFVLWIALLGGASMRVAWRSEPSSVGAVAGWSAVSTAAAAALTLRDTEILIPMMWLVLLASASMVLLRVSGVRMWSTRPIDHVLALAMVPARAAMGVIPLVVDLEPPPQASRRRFGGLVRGALLAAPLLLIFGALFASADAGFSRSLGRLATFWSEDALAHRCSSSASVGSRRASSPASARRGCQIRCPASLDRASGPRRRGWRSVCWPCSSSPSADSSSPTSSAAAR